jgi:ADP-ribose pyrophosphatase YjhB (NUDIX family)
MKEVDPTLFQYCQKLVVFNQTRDSTLLARRKDEQDFDGVFSFIGGKMETTDANILAGLRREKDEEIGATARLMVQPTISYNVHFIKKNGQAMILPHYFAVYNGGQINLSDEYSEYKWVPLVELESFEPKIENIPHVVREVLKIASLARGEDFVEI